jgi:hypothetical protein
LVEFLFVAARLATAQHAYTHGAILFGLAEQIRVQIHCALDPPVRPLIAAALETVRAALGAEVFTEAYTTGQQLSLDEAYATILTSLSHTPAGFEHPLTVG